MQGPLGIIATCLAATCCCVAARAAQLPAAGTYDEFQYVTSSSSKPPGLSGCTNPGTTLGGYFVYPGPVKAGAVTTGAIESGSVMRMQICTYPVTPAAGIDTWSGSATCNSTYTSGPPTSYTLAFAWKIIFVTKGAFLVQKTLTYPVPGGTCTQTRNTGLQRTGK